MNKKTDEKIDEKEYKKKLNKLHSGLSKEERETLQTMNMIFATNGVKVAAAYFIKNHKVRVTSDEIDKIMIEVVLAIGTGKG